MASPLIIQPSGKDAYLREINPDTNYGTGTTIYIQNTADFIRKSLLEFDISELPAGATLISATLELYYSGFANDPVGLTAWAYKQIHTDWVEAEATWNIYKTGSSWTAAGGDYVTSDPSGDSAIFPAECPAWMSWDVLAIVQDAYDSSIAAEFLIRFETEGVEDGNQGQFRSNNYTIDTSLCPKLTIAYTVPSVGQPYTSRVQYVQGMRTWGGY